jgi:hypothetical protein
MTDIHPLDRTIHDDDGLREHWRQLMGSDGFGRRSLWLIFIGDDGEMVRTVVPIDDIPFEPDVSGLAEIAASIADACAGETTVAVLLARPGPGTMSDQDRRWARAIRSAVPHRLSPWPVHLATRGRIQVFTPHDLLAAG